MARCALVLESGSTRGALAAVRALDAAGWRVAVGCPDPRALAARSRSMGSWDFVPGVADGLDEFLDATAAAVRRRGADIVLATGDAETLALVHGRDRIPAVVPWPDYADVLRAFDKLELFRSAGRAGLRAPATERATPEALAATALPIVVKSRLHWTPDRAETSPPRLEAETCVDRASAIAVAESMWAQGGEPMLQAHVSGGPLHFHCVVGADGHLLCAVPQVSEPLFFPVTAGRRTRSQVVGPMPELAAQAEAFLRDLNWFGFASLTFLLADDGVPELIDFNGRVPMSLKQSMAAGVNLLALSAAVGMGDAVDPPPPPRTGVRYQWLEGDLKRAVRQRRGGLVRDVGNTLRYAVGAAHTVPDIRDPQPALDRSAMLVGRGLRKLRARRPRRP